MKKKGMLKGLRVQKHGGRSEPSQRRMARPGES
jgi:hypothetical protein